MLDANKYLDLEDLMQLKKETTAPTGAPKGADFMSPIRKKQMLVPGMDVQEDYPNPQMGFLMWLLSRMRGAMWGQPDRPDMLQDEWLKKQMERPQLPRFRG